MSMTKRKRTSLQITRSSVWGRPIPRIPRIPSSILRAESVSGAHACARACAGIDTLRSGPRSGYRGYLGYRPHRLIYIPITAVKPDLGDRVFHLASQERPSTAIPYASACVRGPGLTRLFGRVSVDPSERRRNSTEPTAAKAACGLQWSAPPQRAEQPPFRGRVGFNSERKTERKRLGSL
jgi:hypothetical protein